MAVPKKIGRLDKERTKLLLQDIAELEELAGARLDDIKVRFLMKSGY